jgi:ribonuclease HII
MRKQCSSRFEREARKCGWQRIAGLDEVGRGSLFGQVVAAAVILDPKRRIVGLDDSKTPGISIRPAARPWPKPCGS